MKHVLIRISLLLMFLGTASSVVAGELAIGLSPYMEADTAQTQVKSILKFLTETLQPGERCLIFDAYHLRSLGTFTVPNKPAYRHPKAKLQANRQVAGTLLTFAQTARNPQGGTEPSVIGAIRLPQALRFIGENYPAANDSDLLLFGSPLYDDPKEQGFTMRNHHIPGDGHLSKARSVTPYGIKGQDGLLANLRVHVYFSDERWKQDDHHAFYVQRFWTLFIEGQGGRLSTFTSDLPTLFGRVTAHAPSPKHTYEVERSDKLEMILLRPPVVQQESSIYDRKITKDPLKRADLTEVRAVVVGITWDQPKVDLDLYVRPRAGAPVLSYKQTQSEDGTYYKDFTSSPRVTNGYETVALTVPVDIPNILLAVNYYRGHTKRPIAGELRLALGERTYAYPFVLSAKQGNAGQGGEATMETGQPANPQWLVIDPMTVLGFRTDQLASSSQRESP